MSRPQVLKGELSPEIAAEFAKTGSLEKGTVDFAGNEMSLELVWSEGTLGADE